MTKKKQANGKITVNRPFPEIRNINDKGPERTQVAECMPSMCKVLSVKPALDVGFTLPPPQVSLEVAPAPGHQKVALNKRHPQKGSGRKPKGMDGAVGLACTGLSPVPGFNPWPTGPPDHCQV